MSTPFKMNGMSFGNSPMKQDKGLKQSLVEKGKKGLKQSLVEKGKKVKPKFRLSVGNKPDGTKDYFKIDEKGTNIKISKAEYDSLKGN
tara:strand:+ start:239 stop:502 length:264 start_codon:yes stop_codon:yes gene_type:complete